MGKSKIKVPADSCLLEPLPGLLCPYIVVVVGGGTLVSSCSCENTNPITGALP